MALVYSRTDNGLLVAHDAPSDERAVARALRDYDPDLRLVPQGADGRNIAYKVYRYAGSDRPAEFICFWGDAATGEAYPLSSGLLEKVKALDKNSRTRYVSPEEENALAAEARRRKADEDVEAIFDDWKRREGRSAMLPRGTSLARARSRTGYHRRKGPR